jgi:aconitate hydratase
MASNPFNSRSTLKTAHGTYTYFDLERPEERQDRARGQAALLDQGAARVDAPQRGRVRGHAGRRRGPGQLERQEPAKEEIPFMPGRVVLQDFTGVPCVVDLAAMRDAMKKLGGDPNLINPLVKCDLVIDHSVQVDAFGSDGGGRPHHQRVKGVRAQHRSATSSSSGASSRLSNFSVVPPATGIVHQVNLEYLSKGVLTKTEGGETIAYPDSCVGTDSHTTMENGLGVVGWGVGGIEAEAVMLGQPIYMLTPEVIGFKLKGKLPEGTTATDLVLTVTEILRKKGVVDKFVEFYGEGLAALSVPTARRSRTWPPNTAPPWASSPSTRRRSITCASPGAMKPRSPSSRPTARPTASSGPPTPPSRSSPTRWSSTSRPSSPRSPAPSARRTASSSRNVKKLAQGTRRQPSARSPAWRNTNRWAERVARPTRSTAPSGPCPQARQTSGCDGAPHPAPPVRNRRSTSTLPHVPRRRRHRGHHQLHQHQQPRRADRRRPGRPQGPRPGPHPPPVGQDQPRPRLQGRHRLPHDKAGLNEDLEALGFYTVGYGCTTCIGNSGPLPDEIEAAIKERSVVASVLSGNRNFEGRVHPHVKANYLASPPLCVAYAIAGTVNIDLATEPLARARTASRCSSRTSGPRQGSAGHVKAQCLTPEQFRKQYANVFNGNETWNKVPVSKSDSYKWNESSHLHPQAAVLREHEAPTPTRPSRSAAPACSPTSPTRSPPTTSPPRATSPRPAPPVSTSSRSASRRPTSTATARAAA